MKKFFIIFTALFFIISCSQEKAPQKSDTSIDKNTVFSFDKNNLESGCNSSSQIVCAINLAVKCTINPELKDCKDNKSFLPKFIFMQDDSLQRPTFQTYRITKLSPRQDGSVEVYTQSSCNGNWFGLCNGNIIYVMKFENSNWHITDMYALEN